MDALFWLVAFEGFCVGFVVAVFVCIRTKNWSEDDYEKKMKDGGY